MHAAEDAGSARSAVQARWIPSTVRKSRQIAEDSEVGEAATATGSTVFHNLEGETWGYIVNDEPQPQVLLACGLVTLKPERCSSS